MLLVQLHSVTHFNTKMLLTQNNNHSLGGDALTLSYTWQVFHLYVVIGIFLLSAH